MASEEDLQKAISQRFAMAYDRLKKEGKFSKQGEFCEAIGMNEGNFQKYYKGERKLNNALLVNMNKAYKVSLNWLLTGEREMFSEAIKPEQPTIIINETTPAPPTPNKTGAMPAVVTIDSQGRDNVPLVNVRARAGYLQGYGDPEFVETLPSYRLPGINNGTFRMFEVDGHSMTPTLKSRDIVIAEWVEDPDHMRDERIYIIVTKSDGVVIKRCINRIAKYGFILAKSDNANKQEYPDLEIYPEFKGKENIKEIWYARLLISPYFPAPADIYNRMTNLEVDMAHLRKLLGK